MAPRYNSSAPTVHSEVDRRSVGCHQRDGRVHLEIAVYEFMAVGLGLFILGLFLHWDFGNVGS